MYALVTLFNGKPEAIVPPITCRMSEARGIP